jgi:protein XagA
MKSLLTTPKPLSIRLLLTSFILVLTSSALCFAGAWTQTKGKMYNRLSLNYYQSDTLFDRDGNEQDSPDNGEFTDTNLSYYLEYGALDNLSLIMSLTYKALEKEDDTVKSDYYGFSDLDLAAKYRVAEGNFGVFSVQALVKVPETYDEDEELAPGEGQYDFEVRALYGRSLYPMIPGYINLEAGYRYRDEEPADEVRTMIEFGMDFTQSLYARIKCEGITGMDNADETAASGSNPASSPDYNLYKGTLTVGYKLTDSFGIELEHIRELAGENVSKGNTYAIAMTYVR